MSEPNATPFSRVVVSEVLCSRYKPGTRPVIWDERRAGNEEIRDNAGRRIVLQSEGGQSSPAPGWELMLFEPVLTDNRQAAFPWTLYGIARAA